MRDIRSNKKINIHKNNPASIGRFKQRSNATLILDLYDEFSNYVDLSNQEISIRVKRPDGVTFEQIDNITKNSNILTIKLKNEVLEIEGKCRVELNLKDSEGQMNTADFFFEVGESVLNDDIVFSSDSYESLEKALVVFRTESNSLMKKLDDNEKIRLSNESTRKSQETGRVNAENSRISKENERVSQENTRKSQEEARKSNENTRQDQERIRQESENTRKSQETNRVNKENERKTNEDTRKSNESDRQSRFTKLESDGRRLIAEMNTAIDETITREVAEARGTKAKLGLRLDDIETQSVENTTRIEQLEDLTPVWQEHEGVGNVTVNDSFDGVTKDLVIKGRTLKNNYNPEICDGGIFNPSDRTWTQTAKGGWAEVGREGVTNTSWKSFYKPNTEYTIFMYVLENTLSGTGDLFNVHITNSSRVFTSSATLPNGFTGLYIVKLRTVPNMDNITYGLYPSIRNTATEGKIKIKTMILEGDHTQNAPSTYFDSITSCGELENNKIIVKSVGKNLFSSELELGSLSVDGSLATDNRSIRSKHFMPIKENTKYHISNSNNYQNNCYFYDSNFNFISSTANNAISTPANSKYLKVRTSVGLAQNDLSTLFQLEEGTKATNYEQYREKLIEIALPFGGGLKELDTIENNSVMQRVGMKKLNGTEEWVKHSETDNTILFRTPCEKSIFYGMCDKFKSMPKSTADEELYYYGDRQAIFIRILKSKLSSLDATGFKRWLQENNTTVFYDLKEPIVHKINEDINLSTFDETTHITQENNILSDISFKAKVSLSSQAKRLREENRILKEENVILKENSARTIEEQEIQDQKITTTMLANTELFEMMLNFMPMQLVSNQFRGGEMNMVEVYVTLIIQGDKTLEQVPTIIRPKVEAKLRLLGVIA